MSETVEISAYKVLRAFPSGRAFIAVDGVDGSGKSTFPKSLPMAGFASMAMDKERRRDHRAACRRRLAADAHESFHSAGKSARHLSTTQQCVRRVSV